MANKNKKKKKVSNVMLVVVCIMIIAYAVANFVLQYFTSVEVSPTLTTAWFAFWGSEILAITGIKISKIFKGTDNTDYEDYSDDTTINYDEGM
jgi:biotin transporter BioY